MGIIDKIENLQQPCFYKLLTGYDCPGCGLQRAIIALIKGNVLESIKFFPALLPLAFMFGFLIAHSIFKFKRGAKILTYLFIFNILIIITNFVYKFFI